MDQTRDPYELLGVRPGVSPEEARRAYRRLARRCHPDLSDAPDAGARFRRLRAAFEQVIAIESGAGRRRDGGPAGGGAGGRSGVERGWRTVFDDLAAWLGFEPERADLRSVLGELLRRGGSAAAEALRARPEFGSASVIGAGRIATIAYLRAADAARGVVLPFRFSLGPHRIVEPLRIPPGVRHGDILAYAIERVGVVLRLEVELDVL